MCTNTNWKKILSLVCSSIELAIFLLCIQKLHWIGHWNTLYIVSGRQVATTCSMQCNAILCCKCYICHLHAICKSPKSASFLRANSQWRFGLISESESNNWNCCSSCLEHCLNQLDRHHRSFCNESIFLSEKIWFVDQASCRFDSTRFALQRASPLDSRVHLSLHL